MSDPLTDWFTRLAMPPDAQAEAMLERFTRQAQDYLSLMRGATGGLGEGAAPADVVRAWREALAASTAGNPMAAALTALGGQGARTPGQLDQGLQAWLAPWQSQLDGWLSLPAFGPAREQQQRLQRLARDQGAWHEALQRYNALVLEASEQAFARFEAKLAERSEPGRQLDSAKALFDLWIDAAEEAWAELALSPRFREAYGALADAQMRVRQGVQQQVERACNELGMPTRAELDSAHRRIHAMQRELRSLRARLDGAESRPADTTARSRPGASRKATPKPAGKAKAKPEAKAAPRNAPGGRAATRGPAAIPRAPARRSARTR